MSANNTYPTATTLAGNDLFLIYSSENGDTRKTSMNALLTFFEDNFASPTFEATVNVPVNGFTYTMANSPEASQFLVLQPAGVLATGTIVLPLYSTVPDGTEVLVVSTQTITALTVNGNGATAVVSAPTTLGGGAPVFFRLRYVSLTTSWYRVG